MPWPCIWFAASQSRHSLQTSLQWWVSVVAESKVQDAHRKLLIALYQKWPQSRRTEAGVIQAIFSCNLTRNVALHGVARTSGRTSLWRDAYTVRKWTKNLRTKIRNAYGGNRETNGAFQMHIYHLKRFSKLVQLCSQTMHAFLSRYSRAFRDRLPRV